MCPTTCDACQRCKWSTHIVFGRKTSKVAYLFRCKKIEKQALKENDATLYNYFEKIWGVRNRHMVKNLPQPYVFMLLPCKMKDCPHPKCQPSAKDFDNTCFPNGPKLNYFPVPIADPKRPWGGPCEMCSGNCAGHYLNPKDHYLHYQAHETKGMMFKPPFLVVSEARMRAEREGRSLSSEDIVELAKETLLTEEEVQMWLQHVSDVATRRKEGAKQAAITRRWKKNNASVNKESSKGQIN